MIASIKRSLSKLHNDTSGAMSVEKILLLGLIALPIIIVLLAFRGKIVEWFNSQADQLKP